jgi:plastocyanin domain-containing protein
MAYQGSNRSTEIDEGLAALSALYLTGYTVNKFQDGVEKTRDIQLPTLGKKGKITLVTILVFILLIFLLLLLWNKNQEKEKNDIKTGQSFEIQRKKCELTEFEITNGVFCPY